MNLCLTTMKLLAAILFSTVTVAIAKARGSKIISEMKTDLDHLEVMLQRASECQKGTSGAVYVRWGHNKCPGQSKLVYSGFTGGSHYTHTGGAVNYLCLPKNPTRSSDGNPYIWEAQVWGAEYDLGDRKKIPKQDHDVPCAVCQSIHRASSLVIPGRDICPKGWTMEYKGLLMAGCRNNKSATEYVCVDKAMKEIPGLGNNTNGRLLNVVRAVCGGSLKCPPYKGKQLVTCAVCTI